MTNSFVLDARLEADTLLVAQWPLCHVRLMNDAQYPWVILVPKIAGVTELFHLDQAQRQQLDAESIYLSKVIMAAYAGVKLNVAASEIESLLSSMTTNC